MAVNIQNFVSPTIMRDAYGLGVEVLALIFALVLGYLLGLVISKVVERILKISDLQKTLVKFGAVTTNLWESMVSFVSQYVKWLVLVFIVAAMFQSNLLITGFLNFLVDLFLLIVFTIIGLLLGGFLYKITKDTLVAVGLEAELEKHKVADTLGGIPLSSILATIAKWYVVLALITTGAQRFLASIQIGDEELLLGAIMEDLMEYVPQAILGVLILLATLMLADFAATNLKKKGYPFSDIISMGAEVILLFFGVILALPKLFGTPDPQGSIFVQSLSVMTDSFKFLMMGVAAGIAIAVGLGLKDTVKDMGAKRKRR